MRELPTGWSWTSLGEVSSRPQYGWTTKGTKKGRIKLLRTTDVARQSPHWPSVPFCAEDPPEPEKYRLTNGDIVISRAGSVGVSALLRRPLPLAVFASYLIRFKVAGVAPEYVALYLQSPGYWEAIGKSVSGIAMPNVNAKKLAALPVPLAPSAEQPRIVASTEALFVKLDNGIAALKRAEANLERYRASVLKAAVEGRLTERWRSDNLPDEAGEELLGRILAERRRRWEEEQLAAFAARGRKPPRHWQSKYKEPLAPDTSDLPGLPEGWCWATVDQAAQVIGGLTKNPTRGDIATKYPYLRVANVYADELKLDEVKTIGVAESELERVLLRGGDLLVVEGNGSADQIGRVAEWQGELTTCCHQNHLIKVRCDRGRACLPRWLLLWLLSPLGRRTVLEKASSTSGLYTLSLSKVRALPFPLAPYGEQIEAVKLADSLREAGRLARERVQTGIDVQSATLRQAILKRAFEGRLVPQDPDDEPAAVLLERIRAAREA